MVGGPSQINVLPGCPLSSHCPGAQWTIGITDDIRSDTYSLVFSLWLYLFTTSARSSNLQFSCVISSNPSVIFPALYPATLPSISVITLKWWAPKAHFAPPPRSWRRSASGLACVAGVCGHREVGNGQLFAAEAPLNAAADFGFAATGGKSQLSYWVYVGPNGGCKEHVWKWGAPKWPCSFCYCKGNDHKRLDFWSTRFSDMPTF